MVGQCVCGMQDFDTFVRGKEANLIAELAGGFEVVRDDNYGSVSDFSEFPEESG